MRVCLIGEHRGYLDEGMRKVCFYLARSLAAHHDILSLDIRDFHKKDFWRSLRSFKPEIIHYLHGPTMKSFVLLKLASLSSPKSRTIISAIHPSLNPFSFRFIGFLKPDLILVQSKRSEDLFRKLGCKTEFLPSGVDIERFKPASAEQKIGLRDKYGINKGKFVILHVGPIKRGRNLEVLKEMQRGDNQVLIVGATSPGIEQNIQRELENAGCLLWNRYFENIEEIYALADCYIFPVPFKSNPVSIEMPLSVLEAMSCNLPIITTRFGALPRVFSEDKGLYFAETRMDFLNQLEVVKKGTKVETRKKALDYSWDKTIKRLHEIYAQLMSDHQ